MVHSELYLSLKYHLIINNLHNILQLLSPFAKSCRRFFFNNVPYIQRVFNLSSKRSISSSASKIWNSLPNSLHLSPCYTSFREYLKFSFFKYFHHCLIYFSLPWKFGKWASIIMFENRNVDGIVVTEISWQVTSKDFKVWFC